MLSCIYQSLKGYSEIYIFKIQPVEYDILMIKIMYYDTFCEIQKIARIIQNFEMCTTLTYD